MNEILEQGMNNVVKESNYYGYLSKEDLKNIIEENTNQKIKEKNDFLFL